MKTILSSLFFLIQILAVSAQVPVVTKFDVQGKANALIKATVEQKKVVGIAAGFLKNGQTHWTAAEGYSNQKANEAIQTTTRLRPASIAKPMTAIAIMQLHEQGLLDLEAPIQKYLPDFPVKAQGPITTRHILTHTSGIKGYKNGKEANNKKHFPTLAAAAQVFQDRELAGEPGKIFQYSSYAYVILGLLIEKVSGMTFEEYVQKNIWDKVGMKNTGIEKMGRPGPGQSQNYHKNSKGKIKLVKKVNDLSNRIPGGGFYSTVDDLLQFGHAVLQHQLLSAESMQLMLENPGIRQQGNGYGFGWFLYGDNAKYGPVYGHSGGQLGSSAQLMILPDQQTVIIVMANTSGAGRAASQLAVDLYDVAAAAQ